MFLNTERYKSEESTGEKLARENLKKELEKVSSSEEEGEKHVEETRSKSSLKRVASMARIFLSGKYKDSSSNVLSSAPVATANVVSKVSAKWERANRVKASAGHEYPVF